ncbi:hypothetical protein FOA52_007011 [Chlamydomonas sp. UWO 241]|nr:hypothetical protein FOA52_007011 [Chlamydomonas sp. UWO 241]
MSLPNPATKGAGQGRGPRQLRALPLPGPTRMRRAQGAGAERKGARLAATLHHRHARVCGLCGGQRCGGLCCDRAHLGGRRLRFVDGMHEFNHKEGCGRHSAKVSFSTNGSNTKKLAWAVRDTGKKNNWKETTTFKLVKSHIAAIRKTLFLAPRAALSDKINDFKMMSWIPATVGYDEGNCDIGGMQIRHCQDGKVGALLKELCIAAA